MKRKKNEVLSQNDQRMSMAVDVLVELSQDEWTQMLAESREKARRDEQARLDGAFT